MSLLLVALWANNVSAQREGRGLELGVSVGMSAYRGDVPGAWLQRLNPNVGAVVRYNHNLRLTYHSTLSYARVGGSTADTRAVYPRESHFTTNSLSLGVGAEFHWYPYGLSLPYLETKVWTPYIMAGTAMVLAWDKQTLLSPSIYVGGGLKYQFRPDCQVILSYSWHYLLSDRYDALSGNDALASPFGQRSNPLRHGDSKALLSVGISWKLKYKHLNCN